MGTGVGCSKQVEELPNKKKTRLRSGRIRKALLTETAMNWKTRNPIDIRKRREKVKE
jgi:hypothetical protein